MYRRARSPEITKFTGVSSPHEQPDQAELALDTTLLRVPESVERVIACLRGRAIVDPEGK